MRRDTTRPSARGAWPPWCGIDRCERTSARASTRTHHHGPRPPWISIRAHVKPSPATITPVRFESRPFSCSSKRAVCSQRLTPDDRAVCCIPSRISAPTVLPSGRTQHGENAPVARTVCDKCLWITARLRVVDG